MTVRLHPDAWGDLARIFDPAAETCAFMAGVLDEGAGGSEVLEFWPTENTWQERPGGRTVDLGYTIPVSAWRDARATARHAGLVLIGHCHTHPGSTASPSFFDYRTLKASELGAVWHLHSGRFTLFDRRRILASYSVALPPLLRALADLAASPAVDLHKLPPPETVAAPPVPDAVRDLGRAYLAMLTSPRELAAALRASGVASLAETEMTPARIAALATALGGPSISESKRGKHP